MGIKDMNDDGFKFPDEVDETKDAPTSENAERDTEVDVEVVDDTPERDRGRRPLEKPVAEPTEEEMAGYSEGVKKRIKELTHARHDERRRADQLAREKMELERVAQVLLERSKSVESSFATGAQQFAAVNKQAAEAAVAAARDKLRKAKEAYDTEAELAANDELLDAKLKLREAENFRPPTFQPIEEVVQIPQSNATGDSIDDKTLSWQARNQWFGAPGNEDMTSFALGLHQKLVNSGVDPRSDDYFTRINTRMRQAFPEAFPEADAAEEPPRQRSRPAAVVAGAPRAAAGPRKVQLTQSQVAIAKKLGITPQQYAAELVKLDNSNA